MTDPQTNPVILDEFPDRQYRRADVTETLTNIEAAREYPGKWVLVRSYTSRTGPYQGAATYAKRYEGQPVEIIPKTVNGTPGLWARWTLPA